MWHTIHKQAGYSLEQKYEEFETVRERIQIIK